MTLAATATTWDIAERALLVVGALLLVVGPALQASAEIRGYRQLLDLYAGTDLGGATRDYLGLTLRAASPLKGPWRLIETLKQAFELSQRLGMALNEFTRAAADHKEAALIRTQLARARNWGIVVVGSVFIVVATIIELLKVT